MNALSSVALLGSVVALIAAIRTRRAEALRRERRRAIVVPPIGSQSEEKTLAIWHKKVGETIGLNEVLFDLNVGGAVVKIPSQSSGVLRKIVVSQGERVNTNLIVAYVDSFQALQETTT